MHFEIRGRDTTKYVLTSFQVFNNLKVEGFHLQISNYHGVHFCFRKDLECLMKAVSAQVHRTCVSFKTIDSLAKATMSA